MTYSSLVFGVLQTNSCSSFSMYDIDLSECINGPLLTCHMTLFFFGKKRSCDNKWRRATSQRWASLFR